MIQYYKKRYCSSSLNKALVKRHNPKQEKKIMAKKMMGVLLICIVIMAVLEFSIVNGEEKEDKYESKFDARYKSCYESCEKECLTNGKNGQSYCEVKCDEDCDEKEVAGILSRSLFLLCLFLLRNYFFNIFTRTQGRESFEHVYKLKFCLV